MSKPIKNILLPYSPWPHQVPLFEALEEKGFKRIISVMHRRCISGESHIIMADGSYKLLKNLVAGEKILSWDGTSFVPDTIKDVWKTEEKETVKITSMLERELICSKDHKVAYMHSGYPVVKWCSVEELATHPKAMVMRYGGSTLGVKHNPDLLEFFGYLLTDGYVCGYQQPKFTNTNEKILRRVEELALKLFNIKSIWRPKGNGFDLGFSNGTRGGGETKNPIKEFFRSQGLDVPKSKRPFPKMLLDYDEESLFRFFSALLSADGSLYLVKPHLFKDERNKTIPAGVDLTISCGKSYDWAWGVYWLLRKLGIESRITVEHGDSNWRLTISRSAHIYRLLTHGPIYGKEEKQDACLDLINGEGNERRLHYGCYRSKATIVSYGKEELYDLETEVNHNFIANGYLVHNSGKDVACFNLMIRQALKEVGSYAYFLPTYSQARRVIWDSVLNDGSKFLDFIPAELVSRKSQQSMSIELKNGSQIFLAGSDSFDRLVGINVKGIVFSEAALMDERAWTYFSPILNANGGWVVFNSTPRGTNFFFELWKIAKENPKIWYSYMRTIKDTGLIKEDAIDAEIARGEISKEHAEQEYFCSFSSGVESTYYGKYVDTMRLEGRIGSYPYDNSQPVHTCWDWGHRDQTCCIFFQLIQNTIRIIDCYIHTGEGLEHYAKMLQSKKYIYGQHIGPHDMRVHELTTNQTRWAKMHSLGFTFKICPMVPVIDGIEACRTMLPRTYINEEEGQCKDLIKAFENYRSERVQVNGASISKPLHDRHSDVCDSFRYGCLMIPHIRSDSITPQQLAVLRNNAKYGGNMANPFLEPTNRYR